MRKPFVLLSVSLIALLGFFYAESYYKLQPSNDNSFDLKLSAKEYLLLSLSSELERINSSLPVKIDDNTVLASVRIEGDTIINQHTIVEVGAILFTPAFIEKNLIPSLIRQVCRDSTKNEFLEAGIGISMEYFDPDDVLIFKVLITRSDCGTD